MKDIFDASPRVTDVNERPPRGREHIYGDVRPDGVVWFHESPGDQDRPAWTWHHLDLVNARARGMAESNEAWSHAIRQVLAGHDETPRIVVYDDVVAGVLPSYARANGTAALELTYWHFAATVDRIVTGRRHATRSLAAAYHALKGAGIVRDPASLCGIALIDFARTARARLASMASDLDRLEDSMLSIGDGWAKLDLAGRIGQMRREAVELRRALAPVARGLDENEDGLPDWFDGPELDTARSAIHGVLDDIAALTDRARSLQDELNSLLAEQTNRRLYLVSIVTTLVMPATFVTGFFGMNTGGLLWSGDEAHYGTLYAGLSCIGAVVAMLLLLKWKRLL